MLLRAWFSALIVTLVLAYGRSLGSEASLDAWFAGLSADSLVYAIALSLTGALVLRRSRLSVRSVWARCVAVATGLFWLRAVALGVFESLSSLTSSGLDRLLFSAEVVTPYALPTGVLAGYLLLEHKAALRNARLWRPLALGLPLLLAPLLLLTPSTSSLTLLPILAMAAAACVPDPEEAAPSPGLTGQSTTGSSSLAAEALACVLELAAQQAVGWGLFLATVGLAKGIHLQGLFDALFRGFGSGFSAWLLSGLLWGASIAIRGGRAERVVARLGWLLLGVPLTAAPLVGAPLREKK